MTVAWPSELDPWIVNRIQSSLKSPQSVLLLTPEELSVNAGISLATAGEVIAVISQYMSPPSQTGLQLLQRHSTIRSGITSLDSALGGGFKPSWLVEIVGEAGSGKTQWALTIAATSLLQGTQVYWIDTENTFRPDRLLEMCNGDSRTLSSIHIRSGNSLSEIVDTFSLLSFLTHNKPPCLIVVDSVASIARSQSSRLIDRNKVLHRLARLAKSLNAVTIVTNHVTANMNDMSAPIKAALGNTWAHSLTCRFWLRKCEDGSANRNLQVAKAPCLSFTTTVEISKMGLTEL